MNENGFGLTDEEFWTSPLRTSMKVAQRLWKQKRDVLAIDAPKLVPLDQRHTFPVVIYRAGSYRDLWALSFESHALITAVDLEHNRVFVGPVPVEESEPPEEPVDLNRAPKGDTTESAVADLREAFDLPWQPSTYLVTVILRDMVSNRVRVQLGGSAGAYHDEEVARFLAAQKAAMEPLEVYPAPGVPLPAYGAIEGSPAIPDEPGIAFAADRVVVLRAGAQCLLRGSFRLRALEQEIVKPRPADPSEQAPVSPPPPPPPTAVVNIALVITGADQASPALLRLGVPSWDPIDPQNPVVTGHFALDLLSGGILPQEAQTYFLYALSGEVMAGPVPAALVAEETLPGYRYKN